MPFNSLQKFVVRHFPVPKYLDLPSVGVDISPLSVRFIEIISNADHFRVGKFGHERLNDIFSIENPESHEQVTKALRKWKNLYNLKYVEVSLPEEKAYLYRSNIPFGTDHEIRSAIEFTLEENVPINPSEAIFDYRIIHQNTDGTVSVAVTVLPGEIVQSYLNLFESTGLSPISFLIEAQALSKAIIRKDDKGTYFIINVGEIQTGLFVISDGSVQFTSTLPFGGQNFTDTLMKAFNISREEAENIKKTKGLVHNEDNKDILSALLNISSSFREEIEKVYVYWHTHQDASNPEQSSSKIIVSGKDSLMPGFREYLSQSLKVDTEIANVWTNIASFDEYVPPITAHEAIDFGRAIGLALPKIN